MVRIISIILLEIILDDVDMKKDFRV